LILPLKTCCGYARFINGIKDLNDFSNCSPNVAFYKNRNDNWEPIVVIKTTSKISPDTELLYDYGEAYWNGNIKN